MLCQWPAAFLLGNQSHMLLTLETPPVLAFHQTRHEESGESVWEDSVGDDDLQQQREVQSRPDHRSSAYSSEEEDDDAQSGELPACPACSQWS